MFNKTQLEFLKGSLTTKGAAIPATVEAATVFLATMQEIDSQLIELGSRVEVPTLKSVSNDGT